jgi:hypothetical protein
LMSTKACRSVTTTLQDVIQHQAWFWVFVLSLWTARAWRFTGFPQLLLGKRFGACLPSLSMSLSPLPRQFTCASTGEYLSAMYVATPAHNPVKVSSIVQDGTGMATLAVPCQKGGLVAPHLSSPSSPG